MSVSDRREAPDRGSGALEDVSLRTDRKQDTRPARQKRPTQYDRVLAALVAYGEVCGHRVFYGEMAIPRFGAHLHQMRRNGIVWSKRPCDLHDHEGVAWLYRIDYVIEPDGEACPACGGRLGHVSTCPARRDPSQLPGLADV